MRLRIARKVAHAVWLSFHRPTWPTTFYRGTTRRRAFGRWFPRPLDYRLGRKRWTA